MASLRIALLQMSDQGSVEANLGYGLAEIAAAAERGADLALLPEIWSHGYRFFEMGDARAEAAWRSSALPESSPFVTAHQTTAKKLGVAIGCTYLEASAAGPRNTIALIDRRGEIVLRYSKVHVCQHTVERYCVPGEGFQVAELATGAGHVSVGAMICYDREFPESARVLGLKGAEVVLIPNACMFDDHRLSQLKTRAFENKMVIAMTNYPASHPDCDGRSLGISAMAFGESIPGRGTSTNQQSPYRDTILVEAGREPGLFEFTVDLEALRAYRQNAIWGAPHRQLHAYAPLLTDGVGRGFDPQHIIS